jgi:hypothetical protein
MATIHRIHTLSAVFCLILLIAPDVFGLVLGLSKTSPLCVVDGFDSGEETDVEERIDVELHLS